MTFFKKLFKTPKYQKLDALKHAKRHEFNSNDQKIQMNDYLADEEVLRNLDFTEFVNFFLVDKIEGKRWKELSNLGYYLDSLTKKQKSKLKLHLLDQKKWFSVDFGKNKSRIFENSLSSKIASESPKTSIEGLKLLICPYYGFIKPKTLFCLFRNGNLLMPPSIVDDLKIENISPCRRYFIAKLYNDLSEDYESIGMTEPDYLLAKVPISSIFNAKFEIKQLCGSKLYENSNRVVSPSKLKALEPMITTKVISSGYLVQRKDYKLDRVVCLQNQKVLVRLKNSGHKDGLQDREIVIEKSKLRKIRSFDFEDDLEHKKDVHRSGNLYMVNIKF